MKKKLGKKLEVTPTSAKEWCSYCQAKTMKQSGGLYLGCFEIWECPRCRLLERHRV
jgi:hypothetical protein